jgi:hypothetical protein
VKDSIELARLCTMDLGKPVTPEEVRSYLLIGDLALARFTEAERADIFATLAKELLAP